jgi:hypothetical protein
MDGKITPVNCSNKIRQEETYTVRHHNFLDHTSDDTVKTHTLVDPLERSGARPID